MTHDLRAVPASMHPTRGFVLAVALAVTSFTAGAQRAPQVTPRDLRPEVPSTPGASLPQPAPSTVPPKAETLFVRPADVVVTGGFPELAGTIEPFLAPFRGQRVPVADFYRLADAIESLYQQAGYPLVRVVIPPQSVVDGGTFHLTLVDGFIERVDAQAVPARARTAVQEAMASLVDRPHVTGPELERALTLAGRGPGLTLRSALGAGTRSGGSVLVLEGDFAPYGLTVSADNRLSDSLGPWQSNVQFRLNQPLGLGEQFYGYVSGGTDWFHALETNARRRVGGGGVIIPLNADGLSLNPEFTVSDTKPVPQLFGLQSRSQLERYTLRMVYPAVVSRDRELTFTGTLDASHQVDSLSDFDYTLDIDTLRVARVAADWSGPAAAGRLRVSGTLSKGSAHLGARTWADAEATGIPLSRPYAEPNFSKFEVSANYEQALPLGVQSRTVFRGQVSLSGALPSAELFSLDGEDGLSTFRSGAISDDAGWLVRQEFSRPTPVRYEGVDFNVLPYAFAAIGRPASELPGQTPNRCAASYGAGLRLGWDTVNLSVELGRRRYRPYGLDEFQAFMKGQVQF